MSYCLTLAEVRQAAHKAERLAATGGDPRTILADLVFAILGSQWERVVVPDVRPYRPEQDMGDDPDGDADPWA